MPRASIGLVAALLLTVGACRGKAPSEAFAALDGVAHAMAVLKGGGELEHVVKWSEPHRATLDALQAQGALPAGFRDRYARLADAIKAAATPATDATRADLVHVLKDFVRDTGHQPLAHVGLEEMGALFEEELIELHRLLAPAADPAEVKAIYRGKFEGL